MRVKDTKKHESICGAAIRLINRHGFEDTSIARIAKEAGVSPATIYVYFENKEELLDEAYISVKRKMSSEMFKGLTEEMSVEEAFRHVWHNFFSYAVENYESFAFGEQFSSSPLANRVTRDEGESYYGPLLDLLERGRSEGVFKDLPAAVFVSIAFFPVIGLIRQCYGENLVFSGRLKEQVFGIIADAITVKRNRLPGD